MHLIVSLSGGYPENERGIVDDTPHALTLLNGLP